MTMDLKRIIPKSYQDELPIESLIVSGKISKDAVSMDVLFVGAGPASLAGAIRLAQLIKGNGGPKIQIGVLEKSQNLGDHCLSGAIINPVCFQYLFPEIENRDFPFRGQVVGDNVYLLTPQHSVRIPTPPMMSNRNFFVASICEVVRWLGKKAENLGVELLTGFPAKSLLVEGNRVVGVQTTPSGLNRTGKPGPQYIGAVR